MINIDNHRIVDILDSRELENVTDWLKKYPNIQVVSRDGSLIYNNAITQAHPEAVQVSDRFHLLKNLTDHCKDFLMKYLHTRISIEADFVGNMDLEEKSLQLQNRLLTLEAKMEKAKELLQVGFNKHQICKQLNIDFYVFNKLIRMDKDEQKAYFKNSGQIKHEEKTTRKLILIDEVRKSHNSGHSMRQIAKEFEISRQTVSRYLRDDVIAIHGSYGAKRKSILDPYVNEIDVLINQGYTCNRIEEIIRQKGYIGSSTLLRHYRSKLKKDLYEEQQSSGDKVQNTETLNRSLLLKALYNPVSKIKNLSSAQLEKVYNKYPMFKKIIDLVNRFKAILKCQHAESLDKWIADAIALENREVFSFIKGITRDLTAVKNAIQYDYNNGLAEGSVNKLKVIKRIMYGRCSFEMLRKKILRRENCVFN